MLKDFKEFALKGNVLDLAIGVIIGAAFGKIVSSLVSDVIMPLFGLVIGSINFHELYIALNGKQYASFAAAQADKAPTLNYGVFLGNVVDFLIIAFTIFIVVRQINKWIPKKAEAPAEPTTKTCPHCMSTINIKAARCPFCTSIVADKQ